MHVYRFIFNVFGENTLIIADENTKDAIVVDPGMSNDKERKEFDEFVKDKGLKITGIVNTHMHVDHCLGNNYVKDKYGVKVSASAKDAFLGRTLGEQAYRFGMREPVSPATIDVPLKAGDVISVGDGRLEVIEVPGHTPGGIALYDKADNFVVVGDSLFAGSIGRTDLPGGDLHTLLRAIRDRLLVLPDDTLVISGHGEPTTIGDEKDRNMYLR